jgi:hypothetical protein
MNGVEIWLPLAMGIAANVVTIVIHALGVTAMVNFVRHEERAGRLGAGFGTDVAIVTVVILLALVAHLLEIGVWAILLLQCGEFPTLPMAYDHSAVNYTTLGYGNVVMTPAWRLLGPLEAANGFLLFGVSTALIFAVIQRILRVRFRIAGPDER